MNYTLTIARKRGFLHAIVIGQNTKETVRGYLQEVRRECLVQNCLSVLIEERLEGPRLGALDVFDIAAQGSQQAVGKLKAIAYVDVNAEGNLMQFAGDVAVNRGLHVAVFPTIAAAEDWMVHWVGAATEPGPSPPGGPTTPLSNSGAPEGPPAVN